MTHEIVIPKGAEKNFAYELLIPQIRALAEGETDSIANISNVLSALHHAMGFFWTGIYFVKTIENTKTLVLGPFQGTPACTRIPYGKGVCGTAWKENCSILVDDVDAFPGHIACSSLSKSEIALPIFKNNQVIAILDVDSTLLAAFDQSDKNYLEEICGLLAEMI